MPWIGPRDRTLHLGDCGPGLYTSTPAVDKRFVFDSFTDTAGTLLDAHTGEIGATWTSHTSFSTSSGAITDANRLRANASATGFYYASGTPDTAEYDLTINVHVESNGAFGVLWRMSTTADTGYGFYFSSGLKTWHLSKWSAGSETSLNTKSDSTSVVAGADLVLTVQVRNTGQTVLLGGTEILTSTDDTITTAGVVGPLMAAPAVTNTTGVHFDSFTASNL